MPYQWDNASDTSTTRPMYRAFPGPATGAYGSEPLGAPRRGTDSARPSPPPQCHGLNTTNHTSVNEFGPSLPTVAHQSAATPCSRPVFHFTIICNRSRPCGSEPDSCASMSNDGLALVSTKTCYSIVVISSHSTRRSRTSFEWGKGISHLHSNIFAVQRARMI